MAKQTFTTGQVLTAAQMTSLQQTAMGGGSPSTKTASYVLTAADAGTTIQMNSASATTITVNTSLFSAGDSVQIQNINTGSLVITAGTATVTTSGSLTLGQWEGGFLFFTSASAVIFFDYTQTGAVSPLTTKGDIWGYSTLDARIPIGSNNQVLTADSTQALGLKWATPAGGKVLQVVHANTSSTTTITSTTFTDVGLTATITPSLATSKILVLVNLSQCASRTTNVVVDVRSQLLRGSTVVPTSGQMVNGIAAAISTDTSSTQVYGYVGMSLLDEPATTSATTYKLQGRLNTTASSAQAVFNGTQQGPTSVSSITLLEIGA
jgi:hypothetical protein